MNILCFVLFVVIAALVIGILEINKWRAIYRGLWLDMGRKREVAAAERDEWIDTAQANLLARGHHKATIAALKKEVTDQASHVDSLMNGDRRCVNEHRYYTGQGISCPHCGANEETIPKCVIVIDSTEVTNAIAAAIREVKEFDQAGEQWKQGDALSGRMSLDYPQ